MIDSTLVIISPEKRYGSIWFLEHKVRNNKFLIDRIYSPPDKLFNKILVAIEGSKEGDKALDYAIELAKSFRSKLAIVYVVVLSTLPYTEFPLATPSQEELRKVGEEILNKGKNKAISAGSEAEVLLLQGDAADEIIKMADSGGYELIVVGSRGLSKIAQFFLGSVSSRIVRHSKRPVLVVR